MSRGTLETRPDPNTELRGSLPNTLESDMVARSSDNLESSGESVTRSAATSASLKQKMSKRLSVVKGHFPKLVDCAHFHYENVDFGSIELQFSSEQNDGSWTSDSAKDLLFLVQVSCQGKTWMVRRSYEEFRVLDAHLHQCIYDRRYSQLVGLPPLSELGHQVETFVPLLSEYLSRLSVIVDNKLNCGPVLTWMEIDNHGNRFLLKEEASLNVPAVAAAHVIKRYTAQASDEISIEVGDIVSVIDMPPKEETTWWRGKHGFQVGFFPSECVNLISDKLPQTVGAPVSKQEVDSMNSRPGVTNTTGPSSPTSALCRPPVAVAKKHGKLMGFLRTFMKSRPTKQKLKQRGILKERVFGCDLGEHLLNSGQDVPQVLKSCSEFIEKHGVVDGIYRHSGVSSNIQKLRHEFDSENVPDLTKDMYVQDIHCVASLCKLYFRELPNPLLTYQLYQSFADCMGEMTDEERLVKVHDVIQQLPPPHYRTLEALIRHLARLAARSEETNMHIKNLAIVWAPNLLRSKEIEAAGSSGADPFKEVRIQSVVVEFLLANVDVLFSDSFTSAGRFSAARQTLPRPSSIVSTKLLSLEEAKARTQAPLLQGSQASQRQFHTILDPPPDKRKRGLKVRGGSWKSFFAIGKPAASGRRKPARISSLFQSSRSHTGCRVDSMTLRSAKSEESLSSHHSGMAAGQGNMQPLRRPHSSSDGLSLAASVDPQLLPQRSPSKIHPSRSYDSLLPDENHGAAEEEENEDEDVYMLPDFSQEPSATWMAEDVVDFSPTFLEDGPIGLGNASVAPGGRDSPPYRCVSRQGHARSGSQRSITEDPDSVLNQSEATARRSLILSATALPQQVFCQHRPTVATNPPASSAQRGEVQTSPSHGQTPAPSAHPPQEKRSFTRKVVNALTPKAPKSPPLDISDPVAISVPAKVLEMMGGRAGEKHTGPSNGGVSEPPQMISVLLRSCDFELTESCQREISSKLGHSVKMKSTGVLGRTGVPLPSQQPPPPPPKNPARLMALELTESANKALRQSASPPYRPGQTLETDACFQRSLSSDQIYSTVRPLSVWKAEGNDDGDDEDTGTEKPADTSHDVEHVSPPGQDAGTLSSASSVSDLGTSNSELSVASSSEDNEGTPSPIYNNEETISSEHPTRSSPLSCSDAAPQTKPLAYGRQFSAPQLQHQKSNSQSKPATQTQLLHSRSESSPLTEVQAFQPTCPEVSHKPPDLAPLRRDYMRRSLDPGRIRRLVGPPQGNQPLSRAFSERISGTSDGLTRYHTVRTASETSHIPQQAQSVQMRPVVPTFEDPSKMENFYYEIGAPEHPQVPPSYTHHNHHLSDPSNQRPVSRGQPPPYRAHPHSYSFSHHHRSVSSGHPSRPRLQRQTSSSVRQTRSELHPLPASAALSSSAGMVPLSVHQRSFHCTQRSPSADHSASQLHPYFENGKVYYRSFETSSPDDLQIKAQGLTKDQPEPIYVNYPFTSPLAPVVNAAKGWVTTDLDGDDHQTSEMLDLPPVPTPNDNTQKQSQQQSSTTDFESLAQSDAPSELKEINAAVSSSNTLHFHSYSDPQSSSLDSARALTGKEIASLLIEKLAEDEREGLSVPASSSLSSSPHFEHPPNPYPSQQQQNPPHAYNVYTPGPSRGRFEGQVHPREGSGVFQRQDPMRRLSGGQYRQVFDMMPSGNHVLKFYRSQDFIPGAQRESSTPNPYPPRYYHIPPYHNWSPQSLPNALQTCAPPVVAFPNLALVSARGYRAQFNQYPYRTGPVLQRHPNIPRRDIVLDPSIQPPGLHNQRGLNRQGSLSGPNWTIRNEGQTRSYC